MVGIDHVVFIVDNLDKAVRWYSDVLGCQPGYSYPALGMEQLWCGAALIVLWDITHPGAKSAVPPVTGGRNVDHVCIALTPFDETPCAPTSPRTTSRSTARPSMAAPAAWAIVLCARSVGQ